MKYSVLFFLLFLLSHVSSAEIYKWVDANGKTHYSDQKPKMEKADEVKLKINTYTQAEVGSSSVDVGAAVVMYSTSWCKYCKQARSYFQKNNIVFTEYDIEKNSSAKSEYDRIGGKGVPVILVGKKRMNGFSPKSFEALSSSS